MFCARRRRFAPRRLYAQMARRALRGELCSFFFAYTGEFAEGLTRFLGAQVENAYHVPAVPASPGSCVAFSHFRGQLNATHVFQQGVFSERERERFRSQLRADLLGETGFRPQWDACITCGRAVEGDSIGWTPLGGGVVCLDCRARYPEAEPMAGTTLKVLRAIQRGPYEEAARIRMSSVLAAALERVMHDLVRSVAERDLSSQRFIEAVRRTLEPAPTAPAVSP